MKLINGDCLEVLKTIPEGSIDLILCDVPYGMMKGCHINSWKKRNEELEWDNKLPTKDLFQLSYRVLRPNGKCLLFSQEPYTTELVHNALPALPFLYRAVWLKNGAGNSLFCKSAMVNKIEDINIFAKVNYDDLGKNPLRDYFKKVFNYIGKSKKKILNEIGQGADHCFRFNSIQFALCTEETYNKIIEVYNIDKMGGFKTYTELKTEYSIFNKRYPSIFNLWEGNKSKSNVLNYSKDTGGLHPTQKPVKLLEDLIKTFSNEGNTVLDFCMGSGSTGVACKNTGRDFIGIELDEGYFNIAKERIEG